MDEISNKLSKLADDIEFQNLRSKCKKYPVDIESKILNDLDDKMHNLSELSITRPELADI